MYLVEIEAGREQLYDSVDALASAIRSGQVGPASRIFHRASSSWVSITVHPEFKRATATRARQPLPPLARTQWTFYGLEPKGREIDPSPDGDGATAGNASAEPRGSHGGLRALLSGALRRFTFASRTQEPSGT